ncbi:MAG: hypothetical protein M1825_002846 [Sarcosagium campestre]|nr:MAG: hypothetical protein M1825_002846 [Sarcosagium campestre]
MSSHYHQTHHPLHPLRQTQTINATTTPNRQRSDASTSSSAYSNYSNPFAPSRTSTLSSTTSSGYSVGSKAAGHKRGLSESAEMAHTPLTSKYSEKIDTSPAGTYQSLRQSLRPLPQAPGHSSPPTKTRTSPHSRGHASPGFSPLSHQQVASPSCSPARPRSTLLGRSDSIAPANTPSPRRQAHGCHSPAMLSEAELQTLQKSSTAQLRTLSKFSEADPNHEFAIDSPAQEVTGMHGRRRLQRNDSVRAAKGARPALDKPRSSWTERNWMDKQRQFLQAYEYLCHIGEAKEWIEDIIKQALPPIVQLEEALRDGVTLAEIVQALQPDRPIRIFRHPKLQYRHSDNIAAFFRFLADVDLPDLFRFELIDLYEKKNIPKVIYCIHALSWILYRKGIVNFKIGNLVGQLQFEHHELEEMQNGLDKAGVSMPTFNGMGASLGAEPEPEPVETDEQRIERQLHEQEGTWLDFQGQVRGAMVRMKLGNTMQSLWASEHLLLDLQSRIRGDWARQVAEYRLGMKNFAVGLQGAVRGFLVRSRQQKRAEWLQGQEPDIVKVQSLARAIFARGNVRSLKGQLRRADSGTRTLQAAIRGAMLRKSVASQIQDTRAVACDIERLQSLARGRLARLRMASRKTDLARTQASTLAFQSLARAHLLRAKVFKTHDSLQCSNGLWRALQAVSRGYISRRLLNRRQAELRSQQQSITQIQARVRGSNLRQEVQGNLEELRRQESMVKALQVATRGMILRRKMQDQRQMMKAATTPTTLLEGLARGFLARTEIQSTLTSLEQHAPAVTVLQGLTRAMLLRNDVSTLLSELDDEEDWIVELQALARGVLVRRRFAEKRRFFKENMEKVIKVQSFMRGRIQGEAYKSLTSGTNPPVGTIKNFVHLLNDSDFDFDEEIGKPSYQSLICACVANGSQEFERMRKTVVQHVRQNELAEQYIDQLDIKIALLVKNKITLDEVVKHQRHFGGHIGNLLTNTDISSKDPFDLKALNKDSRQKLEHYQELFFILQTQPQYLARFFRRIREQGTPERECKRVENLMMGLFGYAQKRREEYYLLKLIGRSIREEVDGCTSVKDFLRGSFFWAKLMNVYIRSPRDRKYMRDLLGPLVREYILESPELDLESDPLQIYRSALNNEELRTGQRSQRRPDITREEAIKDPETRRTFTAHLQDLRDIADQFIASLEEMMPRMPFGIRYVAQQIFQSLCNRFPHESQQSLLQIVGNWIWKSYLQPALVQPETWGVVDRGLIPLQKRNLGEVAKVLSQIALGRLFGGENVFLQPLNTYVSESISSAAQIWETVVSVQDAEAHFDIDEFNDLYARTKPTLYIKMTDIFAIHHFIAADISHVCPSKDDPLREVVHELGSAKNNENEMMGVSSNEISLTLNPKLHDIEDPDATIKALFMETKRCILYIIRVQAGPNLMDILVKPITPEDEARWQMLLEEELADGDNKQRGAYSEINTLVDVTAMSYYELKRTALENIVQLERSGKISRHNHYQDLLNAIAVDIRTKHRRRIQRQRELEGVRLTLGNLNEKAVWLEQQLKSYNHYIEQAMVTLQNKKGKKRFLMPFSKQYNHERELQRSGRVPKFGSFKYSARALADKGVMVSYEGYGERQWDKINLTISSDEVGVFFLEGSMGSIQMPGASAQVPLDDLLQAQFNNHQFMNLFEGQLRLNVNLFLHLIFKKFYRDE